MTTTNNSHDPDNMLVYDPQGKVVGEKPTEAVRGGEYTQTVLDMDANGSVDTLADNYASKTSMLLAAMLLDQLQDAPQKLDFVAKADQKLFDFSRYDKKDLTSIELNQLFALRQSVVSDLKSLMIYARNFVKSNSTLMVSRNDDEQLQRLRAVIALMTPEDLQVAIATLTNMMSQK
jgi:hypothetical protein